MANMRQTRRRDCQGPLPLAFCAGAWDGIGTFIMTSLRLVAAFAAVMLPAAAQAQDRPNIGPRTLKIFPRGEERCYRARFDDGWLKSHKGQVLAEFQLYRLLRPNPAKEAIERPAAEQAAQDKRADAWNWAKVVARLKGNAGPYDQVLMCSDTEDGKAVSCGVECDGGSFLVRQQDDGLAVTFENEYGLSLNQSCGDPDEDGHSHWLTAKEAGHNFMLALKPAGECVAADVGAHPAFAADPVPLRQRVAADHWNCLSRVYDEKHLKQHPKQKVVAIAVAIKEPARVSTDSDGWSTTSLDVRLSLKLRDGKHAAKDVSCTADDYQFRCGGEFRLRRRGQATAMLLAGEYGGEGAEAPTALNGLFLGSDDMIFKLDAGTVANCAVE